MQDSVHFYQFAKQVLVLRLGSGFGITFVLILEKNVVWRFNGLIV